MQPTPRVTRLHEKFMSRNAEFPQQLTAESRVWTLEDTKLLPFLIYPKKVFLALINGNIQVWRGCSRGLEGECLESLMLLVAFPTLS